MTTMIPLSYLVCWFSSISRVLKRKLYNKLFSQNIVLTNISFGLDITSKPV
jgi:hypothetical protein